nr:MAG TPA: hypothetical protein [Bacteriophage sp.]
MPSAIHTPTRDCLILGSKLGLPSILPIFHSPNTMLPSSVY